MNTKTRKIRFTPTRLSLSVAVAFAAVGAAPAHAFGINTDNPDVQMRWDNSVRYNAGWRMEGINPHFYNSAGTDETEGRFKKGDMVTNRLDILSEFDFVYKNDYGFRVSAALWSENAYGDKVKTNPAVLNAVNAGLAGFAIPPLTSSLSHRGADAASYSRYAKRYLTGTSGEFLDAFVFGNFDIGDTTLRLKVGQHNVYWGEAFFTAANGVSAGIGPLDTVKAATSPGAEVKELFMPTNQISAQWTLSDTVSLQSYYQMDWKPFRLTANGTYFAGSDGSGDPLGNDPKCAAVIVNPLVPGAFICQSSLGSITPGDNGGDYGLALRWTPPMLGQGTMGFYYRKYDEKIPWSGVTQNDGVGGLGLRLAYARDTEMFGLSMTQPFAGFSVGSELSYRKNTALNTIAGFMLGTNNGSTLPNIMALTTTPSYGDVEGARGDTWHFLINGVKLLNKNALWDGGTLIAELSYQRLDKVTKNQNVFYSNDYACKVGYTSLAGGSFAANTFNKGDGCSTKDAWSLNLSFAPEWPQAFAGWDLKMPTSFGYGLKGNAATLGGTNEGAYNWSIGLKGTYQSIYEFGLAYSDAHVDYKTKTGSPFGANPGVGTVYSTSNGSSSSAGIVNNHGWLAFTFKTSF